MKRLINLGASALAAVAMTVSFSALAQENGNRDKYGNVVRGPYETNRFGDNWFIGAGGGVNLFWIDGCKVSAAPSVDANFGKWFTPSVGVRVGYQGFKSGVFTESPSVLGATRDSGEDMYLRKFGYMYIHGDFLWNASDALGGYKETRFWNFIPYIHAGCYRSYGTGNVDFSDNEIAAGAGLLNNLRLGDRLDLIVDIRATVVNGRVADAGGPAVVPSATAGLAVDLGWPNFSRTSTLVESAALAVAEQIAALEMAAVALEAANDALTAENRELLNANENLRDEKEVIKNAEVPFSDPVEFLDGMAPAVFFEIGQTDLSPQEEKHLEFIVDNLVAKAYECSEIVITVMGTADSNTGSVRRNRLLSEMRGRHIYDILTEKYGIDADRLVLTSKVVDAEDNPALQRAVVFTF